jgi:uncharacterized protein YdcH (DUF465 family)
MNQTKITIVFVFIAIVGVSIAAPGVAAQESENETVNVSIGQSLDVAVDSVSNELDNDIEQASRNRQLGSENKTDSDKARILLEDLNETEESAQEVRASYKELVESYKDGNITKTEFVVEMSKLNNKANSIQKNIANIEYATQFIPSEELSNNNITSERINKSKSATGVIGGNVADELKESTVRGNSEVQFNASDKSLNATIKNKSGKVFKGKNKDKEDHGIFNITEQDARNAVENEFNISLSDMR